jgi:hypothetical protein
VQGDKFATVRIIVHIDSKRDSISLLMIWSLIRFIDNFQTRPSLGGLAFCFDKAAYMTPAPTAAPG